MNAASAESGMEKNTATVARMLPRKTRIMIDVSNRPMRAFVQQRLDRGLHEDRLVEDHLLTSSFGTSKRFCTASLMPSTTAMVLVSPPCFSTGR